MNNVPNLTSSDDTRKWQVEHHAEEFLVTASTLSLVGSFLVVLSFVLYKDIRTSSRHIIVCISIADFVTSLFSLVAAIAPPKYNVCVLQSFIATTSLSCSFLWTMMLAVFLYLSLVKEKLQLAKSLIFPWFHLICWSIPLIINIVAISLKKLGSNNERAVAGWCWIKDTENRKDEIMWMFLDGKGLELLTYVLIIILYVQIKCHLGRQIDEFERQKMMTTSRLSSQSIDAAKAADKKLIFIPIVYILLRIWGTIRFFIFVTGHSEKNGWKYLSLIQVFGDNLTGAANCLLFCFLTPKVRNHLKESYKKVASMLCRCCRCCDRQKHPLDEGDEEDNFRTRLL